METNNPDYWKRYIKETSGGRVNLENVTAPLMVFIENGWEGFLQKEYKKRNADALTFSVVNQEGMAKNRKNSDINDAIVLFGAKGEFLGAFQLIISNELAPTKKVIASWEDEDFGVTYNSHYGYSALKVFDPYRGRPKDEGQVVVDIHKFFYTAGCIEISPVSSSGSLFPIKPDEIRKDFARALRGLGGPSKGPIGKVRLIGYGAGEKRDPFRPPPGYRGQQQN